MTTRSRKDAAIYEKHLKTLAPDAECSFCAITKEDPQFIDETSHFKIIRNIFAYTVWDSQGVKDHLMVVPTMHTETLRALPSEAAQEYVDLISDYEQHGYNIYARAPASSMKTVVHQHTHLIKLDGKRVNVMFHMRKPYIRLAK